MSVPAATPVTTPLPSIVALAPDTDHTPVPVRSDKCRVSPTHTLSEPTIAVTEGALRTVSAFDATAVPQPLVTLYVNVVAPGATVTMDPVVAPIVATAVLLLLQVPPSAVSVSVADVPGQIADGPETTPATGNGLTVIVEVAMEVPQPFVTAYFMVSAPAVTPETIPLVPIVAIEVNTLLQVPPVTTSVKVTEESAQTEAGPVIAPATGKGFTVMTTEVWQPVDNV